MNLLIFRLNKGLVLLLSISLNCVLAQNAFNLLDISSPFSSFIAPTVSLKQHSVRYTWNCISNFRDTVLVLVAKRLAVLWIEMRIQLYDQCIVSQTMLHFRTVLHIQSIV
jgi:hypothetical protein